MAVLFLNRNPSEKIDIKLRFKDIGLSEEVTARDIYLRKDLGYFRDSITRKTDPHSGYFFLMSNMILKFIDDNFRFNFIKQILSVISCINKIYKSK